MLLFYLNVCLFRSAADPSLSHNCSFQEVAMQKVFLCFDLLTRLITYEYTSGIPTSHRFPKIYFEYASDIVASLFKGCDWFRRLFVFFLDGTLVLEFLILLQFRFWSLGNWSVFWTRCFVSRYVPLSEEADTPLCVCAVCGWAAARLVHYEQRQPCSWWILYFMISQIKRSFF